MHVHVTFHQFLGRSFTHSQRRSVCCPTACGCQLKNTSILKAAARVFAAAGSLPILFGLIQPDRNETLHEKQTRKSLCPVFPGMPHATGVVALHSAKEHA